MKDDAILYTEYLISIWNNHLQGVVNGTDIIDDLNEFYKTGEISGVILKESDSEKVKLSVLKSYSEIMMYLLHMYKKKIVVLSPEEYLKYPKLIQLL